MEIKIAKIPTLPVDAFLPELSSQRTEVYFYGTIYDGILNTGYQDEWRPVGKSLASSLMSKHSNVAIMFENSLGEKTWFHFFDDAS